jgi:cytochrome c556
LTLGKVGNAKAKGMNNQKRKNMSGELEKVAAISLAVAEVTELYAESAKDVDGKKNPTKWKEFTAKMRGGAEELGKAAKNQDPVAIQKAANNLTASCTDCHAVFRQ